MSRLGSESPKLESRRGIVAKVQSIHTMLSELDSSYYKLIEKLGPVLSEDGPKDPGPTNKEPLSECDLEEQLDCILTQVRSLAKEIDTAIGRVRL